MGSPAEHRGGDVDSGVVLIFVARRQSDRMRSPTTFKEAHRAIYMAICDLFGRTGRLVSYRGSAGSDKLAEIFM